MIYTAPIETITWKDVEDFCAQGAREGAYLDYKVDFPTDLAKTIAAMANTLGGIVIIGVAETKEGGPVVPLAGIKPERGLSERVTNIVLSTIAPPVFPEVAVCLNDGGSSALVVVRVPQSPEAPHATQSNTRVYVRTGNVSSPEELASMEKIGWLQSRRNKSVQLRDHVLNESIKRSDVLFRFVDRSQGVRIARPGQETNLLLRVVPEFPSGHFKTPPELAALFRSIRVRDYYGTDHEFPLGGVNATLLQDGAHTFAEIDNERGHRRYYTELSVFGQYFYRQTLLTKLQSQALVRASEIFCRVDEFCASARMFYDKIGYQGYVRLLVAIYSAHVFPLGQWVADSNELPNSHCPDESIGHESTFLLSDWEKESWRASVEALKTIGWAYGWDLSERTIKSYYDKERRR
jgi:hypothetical protein